MNHNIIRVSLVGVVAAGMLVMSACARADRWCEEDATDTVADNGMCVGGVPGYDWEPDTHKSKKRPTRSVPTTVVVPHRPGGWPQSATSAPPPPAAVPPKPVPSKTLPPKSPPTSRR